MLVSSAFLGFYSCTESEVVPDVSNISIEWDFVPFHKDQERIKNSDELVSQSLETNPSFGRLFFSEIIPVLSLSPEESEEVLNDPGFTSLLDTCAQLFDDVDTMEEEFDKAFKFYNHYTGDENLPNIYTFVSGFAYQNIVFRDGQKDGLGIGLDMFLGSSFPYKSIDPKNPTFSQFLTIYFDKKYLVRKTLLSWLDDKIPPAETGQLIEIIIRNGKILYILDKILPLTPNDIILEIQPNQYQWCLTNEPELWQFLLKNDILYSSQFSKINKYVNPAPNAPGIPEEAPGGVANYIGWRIVQDFMKRSEVSLQDLMTLSDFQKILDESKYRPRIRKE